MGASMMASSPADRSEGPGVEGILGGLGNVADVNPPVVEVEGERCRLAFAKYE